MKAKILDIKGNEKGSIDLPKVFSEKIREDIVAKVLEAKKTKQPYGPSPIAGKQHSAAGKIVHRRHVWRSGYGRGQSRIPRKIFSQRGSSFNWAGAEVPNAVGGRRAHPPKSLFMANTKKINKKEGKIALTSALSATANKKYLLSKYQSLQEKKIPGLPLIIESKLASIKSTKELESSLRKILGGDLFEIIARKRKKRSGKGKLRGRKYKKNAGILLVVGKKEKLKTNIIDVKRVENLNIMDLASGGLGRLVIYTEQAIKELGEKRK